MEGGSEMIFRFSAKSKLQGGATVTVSGLCTCIELIIAILAYGYVDLIMYMYCIGFVCLKCASCVWCALFKLSPLFSSCYW